jgi:O-succinylbenzoic acid--CoA ligase
MLVDAWLARAADARPDRVALESREGRFTYAQLYAAASCGAEELADRGALAGERVAIALPAGFAFAQALHACMLLGAVAMPVDLRLTADERARIERSAAVSVGEPLSSASSSSATQPTPRKARQRHDLDATALVIHTSGTTRSPRPVELSYANVLWSALGSAVALGMNPEERWLCTLPVAHVGGVSIMLRSAIYQTTAVVHERFEVDRALAALRAGKITLVSLVATTLARLLDAGLEAPADLRCALTGGGPVPAALLERARAAAVPVSLTYGLTEACSQVSTVPLAAIGAKADAGADADAGPALFCTHVRTAADGEILVSGPTVARSARAEDGWLHTGDLGSLDGRGRLRVSGRKADTIVSGGENVAPAEVEQALEAHPRVLEAAVLGRADERWGEAVSAIVVAREGEEPDREELRAHCARLLAPYKVPKHIDLTVEPLPRTPSGKLLRRELR